MPDRLQIPNDHREACRACGSEKREYLTECEECGKAICSQCSVIAMWQHRPDEICRKCAARRLNQELEALVPACTCEWPAWIPYGHQLTLGEVA